jgi:hypothetical protein
MKQMYFKLYVRMEEFGMTHKDAANAIGIAEGTMCKRMDGRKPFHTDEICILMNLLEIPQEQVGEYFFEPYLQRMQCKSGSKAIHRYAA